MDFEDLLVAIVAGLALLWQAMVWLKEQLDKPQKPPAPLAVPRSVSDPEPAAEFVEFPRKMAPAAPAPSTAAERGRSLRQQLGLNQRSALQCSIILMTVLGPCRANERGTSDRN
jgi:hypothetical protein